MDLYSILILKSKGVKYENGIFEGSFSAVSKPTFASKLHFAAVSETYKICALLHRSKLKEFAKIDNVFAESLTLFGQHLPTLTKDVKCRPTFSQILADVSPHFVRS